MWCWGSLGSVCPSGWPDSAFLSASLSVSLRSELERLSNLVGKPSESHPLHNSGLLSLDPVQDKTPLYSQLLQAYKWSNKVRRRQPGGTGRS